MTKIILICFVIYVVSLLLLFSTSLQGDYIVGSDIQSEYYLAQRMYDHWDINFYHSYNCCISTTLITPWLSKLLHIDIIQIFRVVFPMIFAFVPVILYLAYRAMIGWRGALLAIALFVITPVFFMELPTLPRQEFAETLFAIVVLLLVVNIRLRWRLLLIGLLIPLIILSHWSLGLIVLAFVGGVLLISLVIKLIRKYRPLELFKNMKLPLRFTGALFVLCCAGALLWTQVASAGIPAFYWFPGIYPKTYTNLDSYGISVESPATVTGNVSAPKVTPKSAPELSQPVTSMGSVKEIMSRPSTITREEITSAALGLDFGKASLAGKIFRIMQLLIEVLIVIGAFWLLFKYRYYNFSGEFVICVILSFILLVACIFVPYFSQIINMTRLYHFSLIFLAPLFALGIDCLRGVCEKQVK